MNLSRGVPSQPSAGSRPTVSVLINNFNYRPYVAEAIESALSQDLSPTEIIVVDDGSTDGSLDILQDFRDRVHVILQPNRGQAAAINAAVAASRGEILCFLDSDDWWTAGKLRAIMDAFDAAPSASLAFHRLQPVDHRGPLPGFRPIPRSLCRGDLRPGLLRAAGCWPFPMTSAIAVRRTCWDEAGPIPDSFRISADAWLVTVFPFLGEVAALSEPLGCYRVHGRNNWWQDVDLPVLEKRVAHYRATVVATNELLRRRGASRLLDIADHLPHRLALAELHGVTSTERISLAWRSLVFPGDPNPLRRLRDAARILRRTPGRRGVTRPAPVSR